MNLPAFCIKRPVFASVLSLVLIVIGIMGYQHLQTRFFPKFAQNRVFIDTSYPGASAQLIEESITTPLEKTISGIQGIEEMTSRSSPGNSIITLKLANGTNLYEITNKIRNKVAMTSHTLPDNVKTPIIQVGHGSIDLLDIGFSVSNGDLSKLRDYLDRNVINQIQQLPGISAVNILGANQLAVKISLNPSRMNTLGITVNQVTEAINNSNISLPAGTIKTNTINYPLTAQTNLKNIHSFKNLIIENKNNQLIRLQDIANVRLSGDSQTQSIVKINGKPAILLSVYNATDANPIAASKAVRNLLSEIKPNLPSSIKAFITFDEANFMKASITEVYKAILMAILFVGAIIFISLGKVRISAIPIVTIPVCLFATFGVMYFLGFSINIITLLAIVLSVGLIVDDAIVVLENIYRHIANGVSRYEAAILGSKEITSPVIAMTLTLAAVYAPIGLINGAVAHIFASFAFTLAASVILSGFIALTLSPMMCAHLLPQTSKKSRFITFIDDQFSKLTTIYQLILKKILAHRFKIILFTFLLAIAGYFSATNLSKVFMPSEDMGFLITLLKQPSGTSNKESEQKLTTLNQLLLKHKSIKTNVTFTTEQSGDDNNNTVFSTLQPYNERTQTAQTIAKSINTQAHQIPGLRSITFAPSFGSNIHQQLAFYLMAPMSYQALFKASNLLISKLNQYPGLTNIQSNITFNNQEYSFSVNRTLAAQLSVPVSAIDTTISDFIGGKEVSTFTKDGQSYPVVIQAREKYASNIDELKAFSVPSTNGQLVPLDNLIDIKKELTQTSLLHFNKQRAAKITAEIAPGFKLGQVVTYLQHYMPKILPNKTSYAFTGQAERILTSTNTMASIFGLALVFIYLVLSAQFESFLDPLIILLAVPFSVIGALLSLRMIDGSINIYTVIGLVTLVGLIAKHGILITQFANKEQQSGKPLNEALIHAASIRLRPILMTTGAMIFGALPLVFAQGASAVSREQIGIVILGGLLCGTFFSLILVPIMYSYIGQLKQFIKHKIASVQYTF